MAKAAFTKKHEHFRGLLAEARRNAGFTQVTLAKRLGCPQSFVSKFESGERRLDVIEFLEVARALGVDPGGIAAEIERRRERRAVTHVLWRSIDAMAKANQLSPDRLRELARTGAQVTLERLRGEVAAIERAFPELSAVPRNRQGVRRAVKTVSRRSRSMSAAARKAVSQRMKRYWAERRKAKTVK